MADFSAERERMVTEQLEARGIEDKKVLATFRKVPRERFIPEKYRDESYGDYPLPIGLGQTISQPYMVALMTELLNLKKSDKVLEIGTGSGYQAAILAERCGQVFTIERFNALTEKARELLRDLGYSNIMLHTGDGSKGWKENAPYNAIIATCAAPSIPQPLKEQLAGGGRLLIPVGDSFSQALTLVERRGEDFFKEVEVCGCVFVPLIEE